MHRRRAATKARVVLLEGDIDLRENLMEAIHLCRFVGVMGPVVGKRDRFENLGRDNRNRNVHVHPSQYGDDVMVEVRDRTSEGSSIDRTVARADHQRVVDEVELGIDRA
jgi:hypothetical protein